MNNAEVLIKFTGNTEDVEKKTSGLKSIINGIGKATGAAAIAATGAIVGLTTASVDAYGEFEQLEGGISTLFGTRDAKNVEEYAKIVGKSVSEVENEYKALDEAQEKVMINAWNGYKTAGVSVNEYMSTVSGFAASLKQSIDDPIKLAKSADQAITDMADNANKMGTDMGLIQSAYQGFAKQNYTMLDNLKLGYGGTKTEMERLLADAQKLSGVEYNIENLGDVYEAIHVVQTELGITGTTAKEASSTIQGSLNSTKASFKNFLVSLSDSSSSVDDTLTELIDSVFVFGENLMPVVETAITHIVDFLPQAIDLLIQNIPTMFETLFPPILQATISIINSIVQALPQLVMMIANALPSAINSILSVLPQLITTIAEQLPVLIPVIIDAILEMIPMLLDHIPEFIKAGIDLIAGLISGILNTIPTLFFRLGEIGWKMIETLKNSLVDIFSGNLGWRLIEGLWNGIKSAKDWVIDKITGIGSSILSAIKGIFGIHSPSKEFAIIGEYNMLGLEKGMEDMQPEVQREIDGMFDLSPSMNGSMNNVLSPNIVNNIQVDVEQDPLGQFVNNIKTFSGGAKNDYNYGQGV